MTPRRFVFLSVSLLFFSLPGPVGVAAEENRIVAVVNDEVITEADLNRAFLPIYLQLMSSHSPEELAEKIPQLKSRLLNQIVEERLMLQEARNPKPVEVSKGRVGVPPAIEVSDTEVEKMITQATSRFENTEQFLQALKEQGLNLEDLRNRYRDQVTVQKLLSREIYSRITVSPAEVTAYYEAHPNEFYTPEAVQVATILLQVQGPGDESGVSQKAQDLYRQLTREKADFYELARRHSDGHNARMGGRIGFLEKGKSLPQIDQVLFTLKPGEVSQVIRTPAGFHLFLVESFRPSQRAPLEEVKTQIHEKLFEEKAGQRYQQWMDKLRKSAYVSIPTDG